MRNLSQENNYAQAIGLKGKYHPILLKGVNFGFLVLLSETKSEMPIFLAS